MTAYPRCTPAAGRKILCVFPRYARSFGTFHYAYPMLSRVRAFMPPQGLLVVAAYLARHWEVRVVDENMGPVEAADFAWADVVMVSGMHVQKERIRALGLRARSLGKLSCLGGPSVSAAPDQYPEFDLLHLGELGDATEQLMERIDRDLRPGPAQEHFQTRERLPLTEFPLPAYHLVPLSRYFLGSVQYSSGCPFQCEFCDIPELYGRNPRLKSCDQVCAELDALLASGCQGAVYFVDDNFVGNRKAAHELLPRLIEWQRRNGFPYELCCEATLNLARDEPLLEMMREAYFTTVFVGIETPSQAALEAIHKRQNLSLPVLEAVRRLNGYGLEVVSGIIMGLDTDTAGTGQTILDFIEDSQIPMLTINLLQALPRTPLYRRLEQAGRILPEGDSSQETNVRYLMPYDEVLGMWRETIRRAYDPKFLYRRFAHQMERTYPNRREVPASKARVNLPNILYGISILLRLIWRAGLRSSYARTFWSLAWPALRRGRIEDVIHVGLVAHHLILFTESCLRGETESSFYAPAGKT